MKEKHKIKPGMLVTRWSKLSTGSPLKCKDAGLVIDVYGGEFGNPRADVIWSGETKSEKWICEFLCPLG